MDRSEKDNLGLCNTCRARVPAEFFERDGQTWIRKHCPKCGDTEARVSSDYAVWLAKRELLDYVPMQRAVCSMNCTSCHVDHKPNIVFIDVTNRCNMNCPICIATIKGMGFDFNPPLSYFDHVFEEVAKIQPNPVLLLFGGEPTVRHDLLDVIKVAKKHGLKPHVVTNGIKLADEDYCRKLCEARVPFRFGFDGRSREIYEKLRRNGPAYDKKMKALDNLGRFSRRKHTIIATAGKGFNDQYMEDFFQYIHENRDLISDVGIIPLTENWQPGTFDSGVHTTMEDVEKMVQAAIPGGEVEFIPAGISYALRQMRSFFRPNQPRSEVLLLAGAHPNCESMTLLISDGKRYRGINHYLKKPFARIAVSFAAKADKLKAKLDKFDNKKFFSRLRGQWAITWRMLPWAIANVRIGRLIGNPFAALWRAMFGRKGRKTETADSKTRRARRVLRVAMLPFEEEHSIDAARLEKCKGVFVYEEAETGKVRYAPACLWYPFRNALLEKLSRKYGIVMPNGKVRMPADKNHDAELAEQEMAAAPASGD
jgi:uncharacterized radical SAM superfamily Fe-S cluster-containing enzyme